jgi:hypothetical protein
VEWCERFAESAASAFSLLLEFADFTASMFFGMKQSRHSQIALKAAQGDN